MVVDRQLRPHGSEQHPQHHRGQVGLDTEPGDGDDRTDQRRNLRAMDAEGDTADDREGDAGLLPHVAGEVHEEVHQRRADRQRQENLPATQAEGEQPHGERVVGDVVHIVGPQREDAVAAPAAAFDARRGEVAVMQARAQGKFRLAAGERGSGVGAGDG
ncbi:hypothetical protein D3C81_720040 [compost metagenome]